MNLNLFLFNIKNCKSILSARFFDFKLLLRERERKECINDSVEGNHIFT